MINIKVFLEAAPVAVRDALDQDTVDYLNGLIEEDPNPATLRDAAEPFLVDAGMSDADIDAIFTKLSIQDDDDDPAGGAKGKASNVQVKPVLLPQAAASKPTDPPPSASTFIPAQAPKASGPGSQPEAKKKPAGTKQPSASTSASATMRRPVVQAFSQQSRFHTETLVTMSKEIDLKGVNVIVDSRELIVDARLWLKTGYHYGMIGRNGTGKSTLLSVIGDGSLVGFPENIRTLYIQQLDILDVDTTVIDSVLAADEQREKRITDVRSIEAAIKSPDALHEALEKYISRLVSEKLATAQKTATLRSGKRGRIAREAALKMEKTIVSDIRTELYHGGKTDGDVASSVLDTLYSELDQIDAHSAEARARTILDGLDISEEQQNGPVSALSGGWRMRVALAKAMFVEPDILLLDECTNHLDLAAIAWLQNYLVSLEDITIVCVSHDHDFLNAISQEIIRLKDGQLTYHPGNYDEYEQTEDEFRKKKERQFAALERRREHVKKSIENFTKHARATNDSKVLNQAASRKKKLDRLAGLDKTEDGKRFKVSYWAGFHDTLRPELKLERAEKGVDFSLPQPETLRNSGPLVMLDGVSFGYSGQPNLTLKDIDLSIMMGDHISIIGLNGCGKSTLINIIQGNLVPTKGNVERHARLRIGYYTQHFVDELSTESLSGLKVLLNANDGVKESEARKWLGSFELSGDLATRPVHTLSGGQRARMAMALMLFSNPHLLLLDEVTNHLDMYAVQGLITAINEYEGTVILVSHDRHFLRETADYSYLLQDGRFTQLDGGVDEYVESIGMDF
ncbi:hypothetical protein IW140_001624 [Coemansia sp. RSA 1813]|nr:hypothetical protein EV178_001615 [Coemansia sp. RSA 1646]KAJ1773462.1 hypothetical protein LPJ74_000715 [Coemansia sp. RSA 1843]KAJ2091282.1 hypothetical protein IW138_001981 [Coemansia sp. RSA 986]KAJ2216472.1 hypothetical protein EV179_001267 [Coemansia sp. RSA 487]KAJ2571444.1 hypothetical protein IW140_001624 [Coemansia sp. RSA 1813]